LVGATVGLLLLVLALGSVTFAVGAATGRRALALAVGAAVAVAPTWPTHSRRCSIDGAWLERLSPFWWYLGNDPLNEGLGLPGAAGWSRWPRQPRRRRGGLRPAGPGRVIGAPGHLLAVPV
jgi:hypothetical protein